MRRALIGALTGAILVAGAGVAGAQSWNYDDDGRDDNMGRSSSWSGGGQNDGWQSSNRQERLRRQRDSLRMGYPPQECLLDEGQGRFRPCSQGPR